MVEKEKCILLLLHLIPEAKSAEERNMFVSDNNPSPTSRDINMMIDLPQQQHHHQIVLGDSSGGEEHEIKARKKRAETWVQDETRSLIALRREMDSLFNTSKSNKHLWQQISTKMREKGFDRSPTMCTDKWRNLLKEFKKAKHHQDKGSGGSAKMSYYKEIEDILRERNKKVALYKTTTPSSSAAKVDSFMQFTDKGDIFLLPSSWVFKNSTLVCFFDPQSYRDVLSIWNLGFLL